MSGPFGRLRDGAGALWTGFTSHRFVQGLGDGTLPAPAFRRYLTQDYLFLIQFARAYALAGYKASRPADLRAASDGFAAILGELPLHVSYCADWGLNEARMAAEPEALETVAYTCFVLDCGAAGDLLDLYAALAPCVLGYAEIGPALAAGQRVGGLQGNPYASWIATYAGPDYQGRGGGHARHAGPAVGRARRRRTGDGAAGGVRHRGPAGDRVLEHGLAGGGHPGAHCPYVKTVLVPQALNVVEPSM